MVEFVAAVENAVREYVWAAQWLRGAGDTRLLFSLNVLRGHKTSTEMARPVVLSGQGPQAPTQLCQMLRDEIRAWREEKSRLKLTSDGLERLLEALVEAQFEISIVSLADQLGLDGSSDSWHKIIKKAIRLEFILLRDEEEQVDVASMNVLTLLRAVKQVDGGSKCSIRQLEDHVIELQALVV
ncbi:hypothetical protein Poli38472_008906 [Pythium oligandrum]|uniref:Uncharacterized protein n=1 Tax=Pythium oligandrum TaxID=41045 RepID=A0A8K1C4N4_PYTOL|nr:hypothetical protein Poli38472_008906 [Pythium oligandrum]|eukprot:TMW56258.1 hypothetical protein Poli38472_008906 [Pythium oligandrum]